MDDYIQALQNERSRLLNNVSPEEEAECLYLVSYLAQCPAGAQGVLAKIKEVLLVVNNTLLHNGSWPSLEEWRLVLPDWFVVKCRKERTPDEAQEYLTWWDSLSQEEKAKQAKLPRVWSLGNWISYFDPEQREWYWWSARFVNPKQLLIRIGAWGHPFPSGAFLWLLETSGAGKVEEIDD